MRQPYTVRIEKESLRALEQLDAVLRRRIVKRIDALQENPRPSGAKALTGDHGGLYPGDVYR